MTSRFGRACLLGCVLAACSADAVSPSHAPPGPPWLDDPSAPFPATLSEVGLYPDMDELGEPSARAIAYEPAHALWSNGSEKSRYLVLPEGARVDSATEPFDFPVGSAFFKTFAFEDERADGGLRYAETRLLYRSDEGWEYAAYAFRDDQRDADLLDGRRATPMTVTGADGEEFEHEIPSTRQCRSCHESSPSPVLGFVSAQLGNAENDDASQLRTLYERDVLDSEVEEPAPLADDEDTARVVGYVLGNCVHCHNGYEDGANSSFDLSPLVMLDNTIGRETESSASGTGVRIVPGAPDDSVLYLAFVGQDNGTGIKPMPPLGVQQLDAGAAEQLRAFIEALPPATPIDP